MGQDLRLKIMELVTTFYKAIIGLLQPEPPVKVIEESETIPDPTGTPWERVIQAIKTSTVIPEDLKVAVLAQAILESGWGKEKLCRATNNFAGLKYRPEVGDTVPIKKHWYKPGNRVEEGDWYLAFESPEDFVKGYWRFIQRPPYKGWSEYKEDPHGYIKHLLDAGYATGSNYVAKVVGLFDEAQELLGIEPERPSETPEVDEGAEDPTEPEFIVVTGTRYKTHGNFRTRSGKFSGLIVHYTVSGRTAKSAKQVVKYLARKGYGCIVMDEDGKLYIPEGFDPMKSVAYHAGKSKWGGKSGLSYYFAGMEICCWGRKSKYGPFRESSGEANIIEGKYQQYTEKQEESLINFCLWALKVNPELKIENIVGHDEVRAEAGYPGGKQDPGASLSMTMLEFRKLIKTRLGR